MDDVYYYVDEIQEDDDCIEIEKMINKLSPYLDYIETKRRH
jgi:hypothetical protein